MPVEIGKASWDQNAERTLVREHFLFELNAA